MNRRTITLSFVTLLLLTGCSASPEVVPESESSAETSTTPADPPSAEASTAPADAPTESNTPSLNTVTVSINGATQDITFTEAYCSGPTGDIRHIIGKVENRSPLLEVSDSDHVMLKIGNEKPYKGQVSEGLSITDETVTFADVSVGGAVIDGTMTCTSWD